MFTLLRGAALAGGSGVLFEGFPLILSLSIPRLVLGAFSPSVLCFKFEGQPPIFSLFWGREVLGADST